MLFLIERGATLSRGFFGWENIGGPNSIFRFVAAWPLQYFFDVLDCMIGDGIGTGEKQIQKNGSNLLTRKECIDEVRKQEPTANAATSAYDCDDKCACYAKFGMGGWNNKQIWYTCKFNDSKFLQLNTRVILSADSLHRGQNLKQINNAKYISKFLICVKSQKKFFCTLSFFAKST